MPPTSAAKGQYTRAITLLQELITLEKGTDNAEELQHYNIMGQPVDANEKGLHIVRMSNGKHTKQLVR